MRRVHILVTCLALTLSLALAACGGAAPAASEQTSESNEAAASDVSVNIRVWTHQNGAFNAGLQALADRYMDENPGVGILFESFDYDSYIQTLQTSLPAGTEADILQMFGTWTCSYANGGNLAPVPDEIATPADAGTVFFEAPLTGYSCDGTLLGLPQEFNIEYGATLVNSAIAEEAGVDVDGWADWNEFKADAKAMTQEQDGVILRTGYNFTAGDGMGFTFYSLIKQLGGDYFAADGSGFTINTPEGQEALALMKSFVDEGIIDPVLFNDESNWVGDSYFEESSAMGLVGPWVIPEYAGDFPEVRDVTTYVPLPSLGAEPTFVADSGWGLTVSKNSSVQSEAWDFIRYVALNEANALQWNIASGTLPALRANVEGAAREQLLSDFPYYEPFLELLQYGQYIGSLPDRDLLWYDITYPHLLNVLQGVESADEALDAIEREANETMQ